MLSHQNQNSFLLLLPLLPCRFLLHTFGIISDKYSRGNQPFGIMTSFNNWSGWPNWGCLLNGLSRSRKTCNLSITSKGIHYWLAESLQSSTGSEEPIAWDVKLPRETATNTVQIAGKSVFFCWKIQLTQLRSYTKRVPWLAPGSARSQLDVFHGGAFPSTNNHCIQHEGDCNPTLGWWPSHKPLGDTVILVDVHLPSVLTVWFIAI